MKAILSTAIVAAASALTIGTAAAMPVSHPPAHISAAAMHPPVVPMHLDRVGAHKKFVHTPSGLDCAKEKVIDAAAACDLPKTDRPPVSP